MEKQSLWQKVKDKIRHGSIKLALLSTTLLGNGSVNVSANTTSPDQNPTKKELASAKPVQEKVATIDMDKLIAEQLMAEGQNIIGNFNLEGREFGPEDLQMIEQCELNQDIIATAQKNARRGAPKKGQQTYCLGAVKGFFSANGITIDAQRFAYRAVEGLQKNENFSEINVKMSDFPNMPDGALMAWEKGTTRYGHVAMKVGEKEFCDYIYNLRTHNRRGNSGQRYGKPHIFILKQMGVSAELAKKLIKEGRLKDSVKRHMIALNKIENMRYKLDVQDLLPQRLEAADSLIRKQAPKEIKIQPLLSQNKAKIRALKKIRDNTR